MGVGGADTAILGPSGWMAKPERRGIVARPARRGEGRTTLSTILLSAPEPNPKSMLAHRSRLVLRARCLPVLACLLPLSAIAPAFTQSAEDAYEHAYWLEHEGGQPAAALEAYLSVSAGDGEWATRAKLRAAGLQERIASADLAALMPEDTIVYAELNRPGERIGTVLEQLGLTGEGIDLGDRRLAISPILVRELLGLRAAAVGLTSLDGGSAPGGVAVLDPGDLDVLRGLLETALPASGRAAAPIGGFDTWLIEGMLWVTATHELVVAGTAPELVEGVIERLTGSSTGGHMLENDELAASLALRDGSLAFGCVHLEPVMPQLRMLMAMAARQEPELGAALELLDVESTQALAARILVNESGLGVDLALELDEEHRNLAFDLVRLPILGRDSLKSIPAGSAGFLSLALNPAGELPSDGTGRVGAMDIGRELFGNLVHASAFVLPAQSGGGPVPDAGLCLRVNDIERSERLWSTLLGVAALADGIAPQTLEVGGHEATRYSLGGQTLLTLPHSGELLLATSVRGLEAAVEANHSGRSLLDDSGFQNVVATMERGGNALVGVHLGRIAGYVLPNVPDHERAELAAALGLMGETTLSVGLRQDASSLTFSGALSGIPDVSELLGSLIQRETRWSGNREHVAWR